MQQKIFIEAKRIDFRLNSVAPKRVIVFKIPKNFPPILECFWHGGLPEIAKTVSHEEELPRSNKI
ncbi:uncharacterized protein CANTADRAFT_234499 [Suhomyces tanzawaensis NRRL Y-17324]|uniref:Uncharacterized protein n=1 Tax=Suhomyces tanzawaensis NRRL Y-17324 TaxID=984487 RepID=A0A1E4SLI8_9ASCO|nr:uncharacterized protein CANTADRAFT_234499 [Suhomyces tanzawaensis NRRL Y-17324]ODV80376.1 hypothetical protein CANTADRAFT_234499 [Suhomyces tanzawaensis NRRL Y-17324]